MTTTALPSIHFLGGETRFRNRTHKVGVPAAALVAFLDAVVAQDANARHPGLPLVRTLRGNSDMARTGHVASAMIYGHTHSITVSLLRFGESFEVRVSRMLQATMNGGEFYTSETIFSAAT